MKQLVAALGILTLAVFTACQPLVRPTPRPSPTATATEVPPTPTVEPTPTPEVIQAPAIEGLRYNPEDKKYYAESGNRFGLEVGAYAGETINYTLNNEAALGVVLTPEVVRVLMEGLNTPEQVAAEEWVMPFPIDPRGEGVENLNISEHPGGGTLDIRINGIPDEAGFVSPVPEEISSYFYPPNNSVGLNFPSGFDVLGDNFGIVFYFDKAELAIPNDGQEVKVIFGQRLFGNVEGDLQERYSVDDQVAIQGSTVTHGADFGLRNILTVEDFRVFLLDRTK